MNFREALQGLTPDEQAAVDTFLANWETNVHPEFPVAQRVATNIRAEGAFKSIADFIGFLRDVSQYIANGSSAMDAVEKAKGAYVLRGRQVNCQPVSVLGRVWTREGYLRSVHLALSQSLRVQGIAPPSLDEMRFIAEPFLFQGSIAISDEDELILQAIREAPLGRRPMWSTFSSKSSDQDPFADADWTGDSVCQPWGLGHYADQLFGRPRPLVLLTFNAMPGYPLYCPTIADAGWNHWFLPAKPDAAHGWTEPLCSDYTPQPEVVHEPLTGLTLHLPIKLAI